MQHFSCYFFFFKNEGESKLGEHTINNLSRRLPWVLKPSAPALYTIHKGENKFLRNLLCKCLFFHDYFEQNSHADEETRIKKLCSPAPWNSSPRPFLSFTPSALIVMQPPMFTQYRTAAGEIFYSFLFRTTRPLSSHCLSSSILIWWCIHRVYYFTQGVFFYSGW